MVSPRSRLSGNGAEAGEARAEEGSGGGGGGCEGGGREIALRPAVVLPKMYQTVKKKNKQNNFYSLVCEQHRGIHFKKPCFAGGKAWGCLTGIVLKGGDLRVRDLLDASLASFFFFFFACGEGGSESRSYSPIVRYPSNLFALKIS